MPRSSAQNRAIRAQRQQAILNAVVSVFARKGFSSTTIADIAREASISQGLIYRYFPSKEDAFHAALERMLEDLDRDVVGSDPSELARPMGVVELCTNLHERSLRHPEYLLLIIQALTTQAVPARTRRAITAVGSKIAIALTRQIVEEQRAGQVQTGNPQKIGLALIAAIEGSVLLKLLGAPTALSPQHRGPAQDGSSGRAAATQVKETMIAAGCAPSPLH